MRRVFVGNPGLMFDWLKAKGESGSLGDMLVNHFRGLSGLTTGTLHDDVFSTMLGLGYSGSLNDRLYAFFKATTGQTNRRDAEHAFWSNTSYSFSSGAGLLAEDGSTLLAEDGSSLLPE